MPTVQLTATVAPDGVLLTIPRTEAHATWERGGEVSFTINDPKNGNMLAKGIGQVEDLDEDEVTIRANSFSA